MLTPTSNPVPSEHRFALVIGNASYNVTGVTPLKNPIHDADAVAHTLQCLGFKVTELRDADRDSLRDGVDAFTQSVSDAGAGSVALWIGTTPTTIRTRRRAIPKDLQVVQSMRYEAALGCTITRATLTARTVTAIRMMDATETTGFAA